MKRIFLCLSLLLAILVGGRVSADETGITNVGFAAFNLTAPRFNCASFFSATRKVKELHISFLYNTFGNNFSCVKRLLHDPRLKTLEVALLNEPGHRNKRLGSYEFLHSVGDVNRWRSVMDQNDPSVKAKFTAYVQPLKRLLDQNLSPSTELLINPGLESNLSDAGGKNLVQWSRELFPSARIVWNPLVASPGRRTQTNADFIEGHGISPSLNEPCVFNLDGTDVSYPDRPALGEPQYKEGQVKNWLKSGPPLVQLLEEYANTCEVAFIWVQESNGLSYTRTDFVDPRQRNHRYSSAQYGRIILDLLFLQRSGVRYPSEIRYSTADKYPLQLCNQVSREFADGYKRGNLLKQSEFPDRGAVLILPESVGSVRSIKLYQGSRVVDTFSSSGRYKDGRLLFRSNVSPTKYPLRTFLVIEKNNSSFCYKIPNPRIRID